ncbi:class I SAM-dependent methyltransferase [Rubrivivax albus]|uniref:SAM-dependent methyltransferase n=1 Tax=Rubrivivax albus TaxID=2499835 RepID=A0A437JZ63_9BURK|nr:class I SAM-dependent methyltransferase [Rubrivivax albus]RVT53386.1 SAM-dependent methyltransferase [Rubrivivax albus]
MHALLQAIARAASQPPSGDARRLFHGRGGVHSGEEAWTLDLFPPVALLTSHRPATDTELATVGEALAAHWPALVPGRPLCWVHQCRDGLQVQTGLMAGALPDPHHAVEADARFELQLLRGRNHGFFLDMAEGRRWLREHLVTRPGARVLNLFAYTCAFSVVALQAGAAEVINLDMSPGALATGRRNHALNGVEAGARFWAHDLFASWAKVRRAGPFDLVIVDPPSYQKGSFVATKDWARVLRRLPDLLAPDGHALLCLNAPELPEAFLREVLVAEAPALRLLQRLPQSRGFEDVDLDRALKALVVQCPAGDGQASPAEV